MTAKFQVFRAGQILEFEYTNWRGVTEKRKVQFLGLDYGRNDWYPEPQWFLRGYCIARKEERSFALAKMNGELVDILN